MLYPPQPPAPMVNDWVERHRDPRSFVLHLFGIPGTILGVLLLPIYVMLMSIPLFVFALIIFVGGYLLQFLGHALDGSEPGEIRGLRLWFSRQRRAPSPEARVGVANPEAEKGAA
jgi:uncharacterized membrane protein YGL010W